MAQDSSFASLRARQACLSDCAGVSPPHFSLSFRGRRFPPVSFSPSLPTLFSLLAPPTPLSSRPPVTHLPNLETRLHLILLDLLAALNKVSFLCSANSLPLIRNTGLVQTLLSPLAHSWPICSPFLEMYLTVFPDSSNPESSEQMQPPCTRPM